MAVALMSLRLRRGLYMLVGYPVAFAKMLSPDNKIASEAVSKFRNDWETFTAFSRSDRLASASKKVLDRSVFQTIAVRQVVNAFVSCDWQLTCDIKDMLRRRTLGLLSSQVVEDVNNAEKNDPKRTSATHFRRPQTSMSAAIAGQVLEQRHRFVPVRLDAAVPRKSISLSKAVFDDSGHPSMKFSNIATVHAKADFFSPQAANVGLPAADLELLRHARATRRFRELGLAWHAFFAEAAHQVVFRIDPPASETCTWHLALGVYDGSCCLAWPVSIGRHQDYPEHEFLRPEKLSAPKLIPILDFRCVKAFSYTFRSWSWQRLNMPKATERSRPAIRIYRDSAIEPLIRVCARRGWWNLQRTTLLNIAKEIELTIDQNLGLFDVLFRMTQFVLKTTDEETMSVLAHRVATLRPNDTFSEELLHVDEAAACLDQGDRDELKAQKKKAAEKCEGEEHFVKQYKAQREKMRSATTQAQSKRGKKARTTTGYQGPACLPDLSRIDHSEAKVLAPPGAYVWRHHTAGTWNSKLPPHPACSRSWRKYTEEGALRLVLEDAWQRFCDGEGIPLSHCPLQQLFGDTGCNINVASASSNRVT